MNERLREGIQNVAIDVKYIIHVAANNVKAVVYTGGQNFQCIVLSRKMFITNPRVLFSKYPKISNTINHIIHPINHII